MGSMESLKCTYKNIIKLNLSLTQMSLLIIKLKYLNIRFGYVVDVFQRK